MPIKTKKLTYIAISSCLLGEKVRYDGTDKKLELLNQIPDDLVTFVPICPEVAIGMGIPRQPIQLVHTSTGIEAVQIDNPSICFTEPLQTYSREIATDMNKFSGYIFKSRSPSCGVNSTPIYKEGKQVETGAGLFAGIVISENPLLPVIEETQFLDKELRAKFMEQVLAYKAALLL